MLASINQSKVSAFVNEQINRMDLIPLSPSSVNRTRSAILQSKNKLRFQVNLTSSFANVRCVVVDSFVRSLASLDNFSAAV